MNHLLIVFITFLPALCYSAESKRIYIIHKDEHANVYKVEFSKKISNEAQILLRDPSMTIGALREDKKIVQKKVFASEPRIKSSLLAFKAQTIRGRYKEPRVKFDSEELPLGLRDGVQNESIREIENFDRVLEDLKDFSH